MAPPRTSPNDGVTVLLARAGSGDDAARDTLLRLVYDELRGIAQRHLQLESSSQTLDPTTLVHEAYLRLTRGEHQDWESRGHFFSACATAIRRILVEHARSRGRRKRGGQWRRVALADSMLATDEPSIDVIAVHEALTRLAELDAQRASVVELRFFGGMTVQETASVLGLSVPTVARYWRLAKAWLHRELREEGADDA